MTAAQFDELLARRLEETRRVLASKAGEYASDRDRLHNFKRSAAITGETPAQVCVGFFVKHLSSILDLVDRGGPSDPAVLDEKIGDAVNYLILLEALMRENNGG